MKHMHARSFPLPFKWPEPPLGLALIEPEIPPNTGNIARLCAATGTTLHLVGRLGFQLTNASLRRAGLDYWDAVDMRRHRNTELFLGDTATARRFFFSTGGERSFYSAQYGPGDVLVFGSESRGLPQELLDANHDMVFGIPMRIEHVRSLNLATAVAVVLFEALRQIQPVA